MGQKCSKIACTAEGKLGIGLVPRQLDQRSKSAAVSLGAGNARKSSTSEHAKAKYRSKQEYIRTRVGNSVLWGL